MKKALIIAVALFATWQVFNAPRPVVLGPGVTAHEAPLQQPADIPIVRSVDEYKITDLARFDLTAKVLGKEDYYIGREADLSPTDLALGWGNMSDESILEQIDISQSGRFYYLSVQAFPIPREEIQTHSANMHLIPASNDIRDVISDIRPGDIIELSGSLVEVLSARDNWKWKSSQTRNDSGPGACELVWVESLRIVTP